MGDVFEGVVGQPRVCAFLRSCAASDRVSHAYLFCGPAGSHKLQAATAFARALLCEEGFGRDCAGCESKACARIARRAHPDVHYLAPEGSAGYVVGQIRALTADASLAPIEGRRKVYIIDRADTLGTAAANAFLKTLEEPPADVVLILLAVSRDGVLPTIASRCQTVAFRHIPASEAASLLAQDVGCAPAQASIAIEVCAGSLSRAADFLRSGERLEFRRTIVSTLGSLADADDLDILAAASDIVAAVKSPLESVRREQEAMRDDQADFLEKSALKELETRHKRSLSQAESEAFRQASNIVRSWLRDAAALAAGAGDTVVNIDCLDALSACAQRSGLARICGALQRVDAADEAISYNVSPHVSIEAMLFEIREVLYA